MKKLTVIVVAALVAILVAAAPARAELRPRVPGDWGVSEGGEWTDADASNAHTTDPATAYNKEAPAAWGEIFHNAPRIGDEDRGIFHVNALKSNATGTEDVTAAIGELTTLFYDLQVIDMQFTSPTDLKLQFGVAAAGPRNPLPGASGVGVVEMYVDPGNERKARALLDPNLDATGPTRWVEGTGGARDVFPGVNDGAQELWLAGSFLQLGTTAGGLPYYMEQTIDLTGQSGGDFTTAYVELIDGTALPYIQKGAHVTPLGQAGDLTVDTAIFSPNVLDSGNTAGTYQSQAAERANWQVANSDPFTFTTSGDFSVVGQTLPAGIITGNQGGSASLYTPEPGAASLLGLSLLGLLAFRRKKE